MRKKMTKSLKRSVLTILCAALIVSLTPLESYAQVVGETVSSATSSADTSAEVITSEVEADTTDATDDATSAIATLSTSGSDDAYISSLSITEIEDGTENFDTCTNDHAGGIVVVITTISLMVTT